MAKIADLIDIPARIHQGDFVLKLTEGIQNEDETLKSYVVTPQLARSFDQALGLIQSAVETGRSKGAYLHGSFGSGKSHFMAVLSLLLERHATARAIPELADEVARHNGWTEGRRFLVVPYHLIGATSLEAAILGGYARFVRERHPEAPTPGFYRAETLFADARNLRATMGDAAFFEALGGEAKDAGWGKLDGAWDAESFEAAMAAPPKPEDPSLPLPPGSEERTRLVGDLVDSFYTSQRERTEGEGFVSLDEGLVILSRHARDLGYDAVVLFLDELILWLASHAADTAFVNREGQKVAKLVEASRMDRVLPIVSFIARQRDLRELVGDHLPGAEQLGFADVLNWWQARFDTITLEDRNLPAIVQRRLLRPVSDAAKAELKEAFEKTAGVRAEVLSTLLTREGDRAMFEQVYPFSPALIQTLIAVSSLLQRERTALKLLVQLLVDQRDTLEVGDLVPVGDLYDVIASGDEPFSQAMKDRFEQAKRLYREKLVPLLEKQHGVTLDAVETGETEAATARAFRDDARLAKTLILSALADGVEALSGLTPARLSALNHGTVRTPIPGGEAQVVLTKIRRWAAEVGEIKLSEDESNPTIAVQLVGVDTDGILQNAKASDNAGNRIRKVRELLFKMAGVPEEDASLLAPKHSVVWRGTERTFEVKFANVRQLTMDQFEPEESPWRIVIDYPFDEAGFTPRDDFATVQRYQNDREPTQTLVWIPGFLTPDAQDELGRLVLLDHVLSGSRLDEYGGHLSQVDRGQARVVLDNQRNQVRNRVKNALLAAYGVSTLGRDAVDATHDLETNVYALDPGLQPQPPVGAGFRDALENLFTQALEYQYPAHPRFDGEVKPAGLRRVWETVQSAAEAPGSRVEVPRTDRDDVRRIAVPLGLGQMGENHFVLSDEWKQQLERQRAQAGLDAVTVRQVRAWLDEPQPKGLSRPVQDLVVMTYAIQTNRSFVQMGTTVQPEIGSLHPDTELQEQALPAEDAWTSARNLAEAALGVAVPSMRSATNVGRLVEGVRTAAQEREADVSEYATTLTTHLDDEGGEPPRLQTARALRDLLASVRGASPEAVVTALASATVETSDAAMRTVFDRSRGLCQAVGQAPWSKFRSDDGLPAPFAEEAQGILDTLRASLRQDEHVTALGPALREAQEAMDQLLWRAATRTQPTGPDRTQSPETEPAAPGPSARPHATERVRADAIDGLLDRIRSEAGAAPEASWVEVSWRIDDEG